MLFWSNGVDVEPVFLTNNKSNDTMVRQQASRYHPSKMQLLGIITNEAIRTTKDA